MKKGILFTHYVWIINTIYNARRISLEDLNERWCATDMSDGHPFSRASFYRHKESIQNMLGINILCDTTDDYRYYIEDRAVLRSDGIMRWVLDSISVGCIISEARALHDRISTERISYNPDALRTIIDAMGRSHTVTLNYRRYGADAREHTVEPYSIKFYRHRPYLLGHRDGGRFTVFALDRMQDIHVTEESFHQDDDFDTEIFFRNYFGVIISSGQECQRIVLRAYGWERHSMHDLPMHCTQRTLHMGEDYVDYEILTCPTSDLLGYILSRGRWLKVLSPQGVIDSIKSELNSAIMQY